MARDTRLDAHSTAIGGSADTNLFATRCIVFVVSMLLSLGAVAQMGRHFRR